MVALQAVTAQQVGTHSIMRVAFPKTKKGVRRDVGEASRMDVAKRVLQWRWLIIDDVSMVSADSWQTWT